MGGTHGMGFTRLVQNGRICLINYGPDAGKLVAVCDVIDGSKALVYGPTAGVARQVMGYKRLSLTDIKIDIGRGARKGTVDKAWEAADVDAQWAACSWGKKMAARKAKASANDFDRFQKMVAKKELMAKVRAATA